MNDTLYGKKILPMGKEFTLEKTVGDIAYIKQNNVIYKVNKNNLIYLQSTTTDTEEEEETT